MSAVREGAIIGCGHVSQYHLAAWKTQTRGRLVAVCDQDVARARAAAAKFGVEQVYASAQELFAARRWDFVEICVRPDGHEALVTLACQHKTAALCQKPLAMDLFAIDRMIAAAQENGARVMTHENWRFRPWIRKMAAEARAGRVGRVTRLRVNIHDERCLLPEGFAGQPYFAEMPLFVLYEMGPHGIDVARQIMGDPVKVFAAIQKAGPQRGEDSAHLVMMYGDGRLALLDLCWATRSHPEDRLPWGLYETVLEGTAGTLRTRGDGRLAFFTPGGDEETIDVNVTDDPRLTSYAAVQAHFLECLESGEPFETSIEDNRKAMAIVYAGYSSARTGQVVMPRY